MPLYKWYVRVRGGAGDSNKAAAVSMMPVAPHSFVFPPSSLIISGICCPYLVCFFALVGYMNASGQQLISLVFLTVHWFGLVLNLAIIHTPSYPVNNR